MSGLGSALSALFGGSQQQGGQGGGLLGGWSQPTGSGLSAYNPNPAPPPMQQGGLPPQGMPFGGIDISGMGGLHALLMSLGLMPRQ